MIIAKINGTDSVIHFTPRLAHEILVSEGTTRTETQSFTTMDEDGKPVETEQEVQVPVPAVYADADETKAQTFQWMIDTGKLSFDPVTTPHFLWDGELPAHWEADYEAKSVKPLPAPAPDYTAQIKKECQRRINATVSAHSRENLNAEMSRLQFAKPAGWEDRMQQIVAVLGWIRAMIAASRQMVAAQDDDYASDSKWPDFPPDSQAIVDEF